MMVLSELLKGESEAENRRSGKGGSDLQRAIEVVQLNALAHHLDPEPHDRHARLQVLLCQNLAYKNDVRKRRDKTKRKSRE